MLCIKHITAHIACCWHDRAQDLSGHGPNTFRNRGGNDRQRTIVLVVVGPAVSGRCEWIETSLSAR